MVILLLWMALSPNSNPFLKCCTRCLADIYGRHVALQVSNIIFLLGSALCTAAQNMPMLLAGRAISGIGAAGSVSVSFLLPFKCFDLMSDALSTKHQSGRASHSH